MLRPAEVVLDRKSCEDVDRAWPLLLGRGNLTATHGRKGGQEGVEGGQRLEVCRPETTSRSHRRNRDSFGRKVSPSSSI